MVQFHMPVKPRISYLNLSKIHLLIHSRYPILQYVRTSAKRLKHSARHIWSVLEVLNLGFALVEGGGRDAGLGGSKPGGGPQRRY